MPRLAGKFVIFVLAMLLALGGWNWPPVAGPAMSMTHTDTGHDHSSGAPDESDATSTCCMLACVPVILSVNSYAKAPLVLTGKVAPIATRSVASHHTRPPFHPPRQV